MRRVLLGSAGGPTASTYEGGILRDASDSYVQSKRWDSPDLQGEILMWRAGL